MIHNLLVNHGSQVLPPLAKLLPSVLTHLVVSSPEIRTEATRVLNAYVLIKLKSRISTSDDTLTRHVQGFIQSQMSMLKAHQSDACLPTVIQSALAGDAWTHLTDGPFWAVNVVASLIALCDASLFSHPPSLKFFLPCIALTSVHKRSAVRLLHPRLWQCLIWAFSRMLRVAGPDDSSMSTGSQDAEIAERALLLIKQEINGGTGLSSATVLIRSQDASNPHLPGVIIADPIFKALSIVDDMIFTGDAPTSAEGVTFLAHLLHDVNLAQTSAEDDLLNSANTMADILFDGTLLQDSIQDIMAEIRAMPRLQVDRNIRLSEVNILQNWDTLNLIWTKCVRKFQCKDSDVALPVSIVLLGLNTLLTADQSDLLHIWQSLLLVHTQLTQEHGHLTASSTHTDQFSSIVKSFLLQGSSPTTVGTISEQRNALSVVKQLWNIMKNVFSTSLLTVIAEQVLAAILELHYDLSDEEVKSAWSMLCSDFILAGDPVFLLSLHAQGEHQKEDGIKRHLWSILAKILPSLEERWTWQNLALFSLVPLK